MTTQQENESKYIENLLSQLTLEEKIGMIHGAGIFRTAPVPRLGIPALHMSDGPMGVRAEFADDEWRNIGYTSDLVSYLPCNSAIASTWNRRLAHQMGHVLGEEARGRGKDVILAPGINIKRSPLCGRNFEYMSEDPRIVEILAPEIVKGVQENDVAACVKHFAANSQETERLWVDTIVDERTLMEIYFKGFKACLDAGAYSIMGAYNLLNGEHCCASHYLLCHVLREKWNYDGTVISDWGAVHDTKLAAESELDIEMDVHYNFDGHFMARPLLKMIQDGQIAEERVDRKVRNILRMMYRLKMIGPEKSKRSAGAYNTADHRDAILNAARESLILLKNEGDLLPLSAEAPDQDRPLSVAVIGENAVTVHSDGGGSAEIKALYEITPFMGIKKLLGGNTVVSYAPGYFSGKQEKPDDVNWQAESTKRAEDGETAESFARKAEEEKQRKKEEEAKRAKQVEEIQDRYRKQALELAAKADLVIFVGGQNHDQDSEGLDRDSMKLPYEQDKLIGELLELRPDTVTVIYAGSPVEMPWKDKAKAVLFSYFNGMEGGTALAETIFGKVNPSGKLTETFIKTADDCPAHTIGTFATKGTVEYKEELQVGYRYYNDGNKPVNFCFGHGLSYTSFEYEFLGVSGHLENDDDRIYVEFKIRNTGSREGKETAELYIVPESRVTADGLKRPAQELKAFQKVSLAVGESKPVSLELTKADFSIYDPVSGEFRFEPGEYRIQVGSSSRDIRFEEKLDLK